MKLSPVFLLVFLAGATLPAASPGSPPAPAQPLLTLADAEAKVLEAYDEQDGRGPFPRPRVAPGDEPGLRWLLEAAEGKALRNPFRPGTTAWKEAEAVRALPSARNRLKALREVPLTYAGSCLALWRWGRARALPRAERGAWEDRLMAAPTAPTVRTDALRHALCFALAEADEPRFADLRRDWGGDVPETFQAFQRAFAMLGGPTPLFRLWRLPGKAFQEGSLGQLGARRVVILPMEGNALPSFPEGTAWIIPLLEGRAAGAPGALDPDTLARADALSRRLEAAGRQAWFAPGSEPFDSYGMVTFPAWIDLDAEGRVRSIRMGDAARRP